MTGGRISAPLKKIPSLRALRRKAQDRPATANCALEKDPVIAALSRNRKLH
jgi:hypothetical protein